MVFSNTETQFFGDYLKDSHLSYLQIFSLCILSCPTLYFMLNKSFDFFFKYSVFALSVLKVKSHITLDD